MTAKLVAFDPGTRNFGFAVFDLDNNKLLRNGLNPTPVCTLNHDNLHRENKNFSRWVQSFKREGCQYVVAERFQVRSVLHGTSAEVVSFMLGVISKLIPNYRFIIASQWKNEYKRQGIDLERLYAEVKPLTPHQTDAVCIGFWAICRLKRYKLPSYAFLLSAINSTSDGSKAPRLIKKKKKKTVNKRSK